MRVIPSLLLLCSTLPETLALIATPRPVAPIRRGMTQDQLIATYEEQGLCFYYTSSKRPSWSGADQFPCIKYCKEKKNSDYSECDVSFYKDVDLNNIQTKAGVEVKTDMDGNPYLVSPCKCENEAVEEILTEIVEIVAEGLKDLDKILCAVGLSVFQTIADVGLMFVPGGQELEAARVAVQAAKTFSENALEAGDWMNWVGNTCGLPDFNFNIWSVLISAPDDMGRSQGCKRKKKAACNAPPEGKPFPTDKPDKPKDTSVPKKSDKPEESGAPKSSEARAASSTGTPMTSSSAIPAPSSSGGPASSSSASACQVTKRAVPTLSLPTVIPSQLLRRADPPTTEWTEDNTVTCGDDELELQVDPQPFSKGSTGSISKGTTHEGLVYALKSSEKSLTNEYNIMKKTLGDNDNIIKVYSTCDLGLYNWFMMDLATGGDLEARMTAKMYLKNEALTKVVMAQVMNGMVFAHSKGVAHNDLKGGNVVFGTNDVVKIIDFGEATKETSVSKIETTPGISSPEVEATALQTGGIDPKLNDVWSLAVLMVNMLNGGKPWTTAGAVEARAIWEKPNTAAARSTACKKQWPQFTTEFCDVLVTVFQPQSGRTSLARFAAAIANPSLQLIDDCNKKST